MKKIVNIIACCLCALHINAQSTIGEAWKAMPDSILPYLNSATRTELVDMYNIKKGSKTKNLLGGESWIKELSDKYLSVQLNGTTQLDMRLLPTTDSTSIVCMVKTYGATPKESEIAFFDANWNPIKNNFSLPDFSNRDTVLALLTQKPDTIDTEKFEEMKREFEPATTCATLGKDDAPTITFSINGLLLTNDEENKLKNIKMQKSFKWNGEIFK